MLSCSKLASLTGGDHPVPRLLYTKYSLDKAYAKLVHPCAVAISRVFRNERVDIHRRKSQKSVGVEKHKDDSDQHMHVCTPRHGNVRTEREEAKHGWIALHKGELQPTQDCKITTQGHTLGVGPVRP